MIINNALLDSLTEQAKANPRLRQSYDLRNSPDDESQRMLNAIEPGSEMPIHRHKFTSETVVCLRGCLVEEFFDELDGSAGSPQVICTERIELTPNGPVVAVNVPAGQWHRVYAKESGTVLLESKNGKWEPLGEEDILQM